MAKSLKLISSETVQTIYVVTYIYGYMFIIYIFIYLSIYGENVSFYKENNVN